MDLALIASALSSLKAAKDLGQAALDIRDFNQVATTISQINDNLLKAEESLFTHNTQLMDLQQKYFEASEELRKLRESVSERARYSLFEITPGVFVYRMNVPPQLSGAGDPAGAEPKHYVCQHCMDRGIKAVLQLIDPRGTTVLTCPACQTTYRTGTVGSRAVRPSR